MNTTDLLPPLPNPDLGMPWRVNAPDGSAHSAGYTADQMQAYAAQAVETLRSQLAHWKTFAIHAEGEHAAWKKAATELDEELRALKAAAADGRTYTQADLLEAVKTERARCAQVCDVTPPYPFRPSIEAAHAIRTFKDAP